MGCIPSKNYVPKSKSIKPIMYNIPETISSPKLSSPHTNRCVPPDTLCLKIKISEDDIGEWESRSALISNYANEVIEQCNFVFKEHFKFNGYLTHLEDIFHGICITDYDLSKGIQLFLLYIKINSEEKLKIAKISQFPYIVFENCTGCDFEKFITAWNNLVEYLKGHIEDNKIRPQIEVLKKYVNGKNAPYSNNNKNANKIIVKTINKFAELAMQTEEKVEKSIEDIKKFSFEIDKIEREIGKKAKNMANFKGFNITALAHST